MCSECDNTRQPTMRRAQASMTKAVGLRSLHEAGHLLIVVTNQSAVGCGMEPRPPWLAPPTFQCEGATVSVESTRTLVRIGVKQPIPQLRCMVARTSGSSSAAYER